jgi:pimeloyl-ACP methyl ester carboxylesterase
VIAIDETGQGEPLVLLHGLGASRGVWKRATRRLGRDRLVLAPDLPGFGESAPAGPGFDLESAADALVGPLSRRAGQPFDLLGNSLGGAVAVELAIRRPDLVRRLILSAPAGFSAAPWPLALAAGTVVGPAMALRRVLGPVVVPSPTARRALLWGAVAEPQRLSTRDARAMLQASRGSTRIGPAVSTVLRADLRARLTELEVPLGLIWGRRDRVVPISTLDAIHELRPDARAEIIERAAHVPQLERPQAFVAAVRRLLEALA